MTQRSTKGASKQRRDAINALIAQKRELLPVAEAVRSRLSQLQVMALANAYIANSNFFARRFGLEAASRSAEWSELFDICPTLPGFLLVAAADGRILYVSDSVSEYLGNSAVDIMTQMETVYELIDDRDREVLRQAMQQRQALPASSAAAAATNPWMRDIQAREQSSEGIGRRVSFTCRMNVAARGVRNNSNAAMQSSMKFGFDRQKIMQVSGRILQQELPGYCSPSSYNSNDQSSLTVLVACCTPHLGVSTGNGAMSAFGSTADNIEGNTNAFSSLHYADMKFAKIEPNGEYHTGYTRDVIYGKSWYEMIHPADLDEARCKHIELIGDYQVGDLSSAKSVCIRIQSARGDFLWLHVVMRVYDNECATGSVPISGMLPHMLNTTTIQPLITCTNHVIDEEMALFLRAREKEVQLTMREDSPQTIYPPSVATSNAKICDGMNFPDFQLGELLSPITTERISRQNSGRGLKRRYNNSESNGAVMMQKIPKVIEEEPFDGNSMQNMLSMPSPPISQLEYDALEKPFQTSFTQFTQHTGYLGSGFNNQEVMATGSGMTSSTVQLQIPESFVTPRSSPVLVMQDSSMPEAYMAVPDMRSNNLEFDNQWEYPTLYCSDPVSSYKPTSIPPRSVLGEYQSTMNNVGVILPELDQSVVESVLEECTNLNFQCGYTTGCNPMKMMTGAGIPQHHHQQQQQQLMDFREEDGTSLIHELLTLGQDFLDSQLGSIYRTSNPLYFV